MSQPFDGAPGPRHSGDDSPRPENGLEVRRADLPLGDAALNSAVVMHQARPRRGAILAVVAVVAIGIAVTAASIGFGGRDKSGAANNHLPPATTPVTRMTLTQTESVDGTLGYGDATPVSYHQHGTITALPATGTTISQDHELFEVDASPVLLMYGTVPLYRPLASGVNGADVKQFETDLAALGYKGFTVDETYNASTASAVDRWQDDHDLTQTGRIGLGSVVFTPGPARIDSVTGHVGDPATGVILSYTGTTRVVTIDLDVSKQQLAKVGVSATITLPDNSTVAGKVTAVGTVASRQGSVPNVAATASTTIEVTVSVSDQAKVGTLDSAPVQVALTSDQRANVLTVPVAALLALSEGGYGVQVVSGGTSHIVAVQVGMFAGGRVEISGAGIDVGTLVGVPT